MRSAATLAEGTGRVTRAMRKAQRGGFVWSATRRASSSAYSWNHIAFRIADAQARPRTSIQQKYHRWAPGTGNGERGTGNREQGTGNREQGTGNREQGTGNREQGTG